MSHCIKAYRSEHVGQHQQAMPPLCLSPYPLKIFVEMTTRCNMRCGMCVKYAKGSRIPERDMSLELFARMSSSLKQAQTLIFSGIGEPLLNEQTIPSMALARSIMPPQARIGLQTNGLLLDEKRCGQLVDAGLDLACVSVDLLAGAAKGCLHGGEHLPAIRKAFTHLKKMSATRTRPLQLGIETVLLRDNFRQLPDIVRLAGEQGLDFLLASHMLPYESNYTGQSIMNPNSAKAMALYAEFRAVAEQEGLDLRDYFVFLPKYGKTAAQHRLLRIVEEMARQGVEQGLWMNLHHLFAWQDSAITRELKEIYEQSKELAANYGLKLRLPPLFAADERKCPFIEDKACFVDQEGNVSSCHFLWHRYTCYLEGVEKIVQPHFFGNVERESLESIWRSLAYTAFRGEAADYSYPNCTNCGSKPCAEVTGHRGAFETDCLGFHVPCGHCPWPSSMLACLD